MTTQRTQELLIPFDTKVESCNTTIASDTNIAFGDDLTFAVEMQKYSTGRKTVKKLVVRILTKIVISLSKTLDDY